MTSMTTEMELVVDAEGDSGSGWSRSSRAKPWGHDGKKTDGGTLKNLARAIMWLLVISRSPVRIAESVDCEIPTAFESAV